MKRIISFILSTAMILGILIPLEASAKSAGLVTVSSGKLYV